MRDSVKKKMDNTRIIYGDIGRFAQNSFRKASC